jgi:hypothetical protein
LFSLLFHVGVLLHLCCNEVVLCYICVATFLHGFILGLYHALTFLFFYLFVLSCICFVGTLCCIRLVFFVVLPLYCNVFLYPCVESWLFCVVTWLFCFTFVLYHVCFYFLPLFCTMLVFISYLCFVPCLFLFLTFVLYHVRFYFLPLFCTMLVFISYLCFVPCLFLFLTFVLYHACFIFYLCVVSVCFILPVCCIMLLVPDGIIRPIIIVGTLAWSIRYIYYWNLVL